MGKLVSLEEVSASTLPAKVLVLLSKYSKAMRKHTGVVIKISSLNVFSHVHNTNKLSNHLQTQQIHHELLLEVNRHLDAGTMQTVRERERHKLRSYIASNNRNRRGQRNGARLNTNNPEIERTLSLNI